MEGYTNLEFNLDKGQRGDSKTMFVKYFLLYVKVSLPYVVNNNAAAVMLSINEFAKGGEVIVSREN